MPFNTDKHKECHFVSRVRSAMVNMTLPKGLEKDAANGALTYGVYDNPPIAIMPTHQ
jgi:hypothetical protein